MQKEQTKPESKQPTPSLNLSERELGLIKECLLMVAKLPNVAPEQMRELLILNDKVIIEK